MNNTQVANTSYTAKAGYVFRKRCTGGTLSISLQTKEAPVAVTRSASMMIRFLQLEPLALPFEALHVTLKNYRDEMVRNEKIASLTATLATPVSVTEALTVAPATVSAQIALQAATDAVEGHTLESVKAEYVIEKDRDWREKTKKENCKRIDLFISWCALQGFTTIEEINKPIVSEFKTYLDSLEYAPQSKQLYLDTISAFFTFALDMRDYISTNPFRGMSYKNVKNITKKEIITKAQYEALMSVNEVKNNDKYKYLLAMFFHTGVRRSELRQWTKADYVEIEGVKCISVNAEGEKTVKNESSVRNIPLNEALLELGVWEKKPVFNGTDKQIDYMLSKIFKFVSIKRSSHCFRHSISDRLRDTQANDSTRAFILGHAQELITDRVYISAKPLLAMKAALDATI